MRSARHHGADAPREPGYPLLECSDLPESDSWPVWQPSVQVRYDDADAGEVDAMIAPSYDE